MAESFTPEQRETIDDVLAIPDHQLRPVLAWVAARNPGDLADALRAFGIAVGK